MYSRVEYGRLTERAQVERCARTLIGSSGAALGSASDHSVRPYTLRPIDVSRASIIGAQRVGIYSRVE